MNKRICQIENCDRSHMARGWCAAHYKRWQTGSIPMSRPVRNRRTLIPATCEISGCDAAYLARGMCDKHYRRRRRKMNPSLQREYDRRRYWKLKRGNPDKLRRKWAKWREKNREYEAQRSLANRHRSKEELGITDDSSCFYCGEPASEADHFVPRSLGGLLTVGNTVAACRSCNASKNNKPPEDLLSQLELQS